MFGQALYIFFAGAMFIHGIAHILGFWMPAHSWIIPTPKELVERVFSSIFWILSAVGFVAAMFSFLGVILPSDWWQPLSIGAACISLTGLVLFGKNWMLFNLMGAIAMNLCILAVIFLGIVI